MRLTFEPVVDDDADAVVAFLRGNEWPFHSVSRPSVEQARAVGLSDAATRSFWIRDSGVVVGLVRLLDLDDVEHGSPLFDLRIADEHRGKGLGTEAVTWLSRHLFTEFPVLHRIEATTRGDNAAMQAVLERCGYRREGVLREAWTNADGSRHDAMIYGLLRSEWSSSDRRNQVS